MRRNGGRAKHDARGLHQVLDQVKRLQPEGSIGGAAMDNVLKICRALDMTVEELDNALAKPLPAHTPGEGGIDPNLLALIRKLPAEKQRALKLLLTET